MGLEVCCRGPWVSPDCSSSRHSESVLSLHRFFIRTSLTNDTLLSQRPVHSEHSSLSSCVSSLLCSIAILLAILFAASFFHAAISSRRHLFISPSLHVAVSFTLIVSRGGPPMVTPKCKSFTKSLNNYYSTASRPDLPLQDLFYSILYYVYIKDGQGRKRGR